MTRGSEEESKAGSSNPEKPKTGRDPSQESGGDFDEKYSIQSSSASRGGVAVLVILEVVFIAYYSVSNGRYMPASEMLESERNTYIRDAASDGCSFIQTLFPHPYLGHVMNPVPPVVFQISLTGFI